MNAGNYIFINDIINEGANYLKNIYILIVAVFLFSSCQPGQKESQKSNKDDEIVPAGEMVGNYLIDWILDAKSGDENQLSSPTTIIVININGKKYNLFEDAQQGEYYQLDSVECKNWEIPESSISTILGGYAGLYRCIYVEKQENELFVKQAWSDAESSVEGWMDFEIIKKIKLIDLKQ